MYRESILGLALAATLAEMHPRLTARQEEEVWRIFDASMEVSVAAAPLMSHVAVHIPPPSSVAGGGMTAVSTAMPQIYIPAQASCDPTDATEEAVAPVPTNTEEPQAAAASSTLPSPSCAAPFDDRNIAFPVYHLCDGVWTILLKDPTVIVRDEFGKSEKMQLDYLRVRLKDITSKSTESKRKRAKKA
jgi:hypothetical protein